MIRAAIVEDSDDEFATLSNALKAYEESRKVEIRQTRFASGEMFLENFPKGYDIVFLDIALPGLSGMQTAESLRKMDDNIPIIFVTNLAQYAVNGYKVNAYDFIVKPVNYPDLEFKLDRLIEKMSVDVKEKILIKVGAQHVAVLISDIRYIEIQGHTLTYHTTRGDFVTSGALHKVNADFEGHNFYKCNACYLVNLQYVDSVVGYEVHIGQTKLVISHPRRKEFVKALNEFFQKTL